MVVLLIRMIVAVVVVVHDHRGRADLVKVQNLNLIDDVVAAVHHKLDNRIVVA